LSSGKRPLFTTEIGTNVGDEGVRSMPTFEYKSYQQEKIVVKFDLKMEKQTVTSTR